MEAILRHPLLARKMTHEGIEFRAIPDCPDYWASACGKITSTCTAGSASSFLGSPHFLSLHTNTSGYLTFRVWKPKPAMRYQTKTVHSSVLEAWVGPRPKGFVARHLNSCKTDNSATNLAWGTFAENQQDVRRHGNRAGEKNKRGKLTADTVLKLRELNRSTPLVVLLRDHLPEGLVSRNALSSAMRGATWRHLPGAFHKYRSGLTEHSVAQLRHEYASVSVTQLLKRHPDLKVSRSALTAAMSGQTWRKVHGAVIKRKRIGRPRT